MQGAGQDRRLLTNSLYSQLEAWSTLSPANRERVPGWGALPGGCGWILSCAATAKAGAEARPGLQGADGGGGKTGSHSRVPSLDLLPRAGSGDGGGRRLNVGSLIKGRRRSGAPPHPARSRYPPGSPARGPYGRPGRADLAEEALSTARTDPRRPRPEPRRHPYLPARGSLRPPPCPPPPHPPGRRTRRTGNTRARPNASRPRRGRSTTRPRKARTAGKRRPGEEAMAAVAAAVAGASRSR